jgi:2-amino-4-hydroxy-6-hydroxymethyldihydropteridine diphosphokinase
MKQTAFLALGSSLGDRIAFLQTAADQLGTAFPLMAASPVFETEPSGMADPAPFLNAVVAGLWTGSADELLALTRTIENRAGRAQKGLLQPRTLDIDILYLGNTQMDSPTLSIPHPRIEIRNFVLLPLWHLAPGFRDCRTEKTMAEMLAGCPPGGWIHPAGTLKLPGSIGLNPEIE